MVVVGVGVNPHVGDVLVDGVGAVYYGERSEVGVDVCPCVGYGEVLSSFPERGDGEPEIPVGQLEGRVDGCVWICVLAYRIHWRAEIVMSCFCSVPTCTSHPPIF